MTPTGARRRRGSRRGRWTAGLLVLALLLGAGAGASWAYWTGTGDAVRGTGAAMAATVEQGASPTVTRTGAGAVTVEWGASTLSDGAPVDGYLVKRYNVAGGAEETVGAGCTGTRTTLACTETGLPTGVWQYTVTPLLATHWRGPESAKSGVVSTGTGTLTLNQSLFGGPLLPLPALATGTVAGLLPGEAIKYAIDGVAVAGTPTVVGSGGGASITSLDVPELADGAHTVTVTGATSGLVASAGILVDSTPPVLAAHATPGANAAGWNNGPVEVTITADDGGGSGVSYVKFTTDGSDPRTSPTAQLYHGETIANPESRTIRFYGVDLAGNASAVQTLVLKIDTVLPAFTLGAADVTGGVYVAAGSSSAPDVIYYRGSEAGSFRLKASPITDGGSPVASLGSSALTEPDAGFTHEPGVDSTPDPEGNFLSNQFSWAAGTGGQPAETLTATDAAGNTTIVEGSLINDSTPPSGGSVEAGGLIGTDGRYTSSTTVHLTLNPGSDSGSGPDTGEGKLLRASAPLLFPGGVTSGECGTYGSYGQVGASGPGTSVADTVPADESCYRYEYRVPDNVGNSATYLSGAIKVDELGPINTAVPAISGTAQQGGELTASTGTWIHSPTAYSYQWQRCASEAGKCSSIAGATASGYSPVAEDVGETLRVAVTATNASNSASATSEQSAPVLIAAPADTGAPVISGTAQQGQTLTGSTGTWSNSPTAYTRQWRRCTALGEACEDISGATASSYTPVEADVGRTLAVLVTATNASGSTSAASAVTGVVAGPITEFSSGLNAGSKPIGIGAGPEGNIWFADIGTTPALGKLSIGTGAITEYTSGLNAGALPMSVSPGPDGNMWFVDRGTTKAIGKINPTTHAITEYTTGLIGGTSPRYIIAGPDGNMWFADQGGAIGRITTSGTVTNYTAGLNAGSSPRFITAGPDGNLWFIDRGTTQAIGKINPSTGAITEYSTGLNAGSNIYGIAAGADGNLWFADQGTTPAIGKITPAGVISEYSSGLPAGSMPDWVGAGADGDVWFADQGKGAMGRITPSGTITEYTSGMNTGTNPNELAGGTEGNLWFADRGTTAAIGRVAVGGVINTSLPGLSGTAQQGQTLSTTNGSWNYSPTAYSYQWQDCNTAGEACAAISGATSTAYKLAESDAGSTVRALVTAKNSLGSVPVASTQTSTIPYTPPVNAGLPAVSGTVQQGHMLSTTNGTWTGGGLSYTYQWQDCNTSGTECAAISGATASGYALQPTDVGKTIRVTVTAANTGGSAPATSEQTTTVLIEAPVDTVPPSITGTAQQAQTLTGSTGTWANTPTGYTYRWRRCNTLGEACSGISGATAATYTPIALDVGNTLRLSVTASNAAGPVLAESAPTSLVVGPITEFSTGITAASYPRAITEGPDGNLWFTEASGSRIGKITPAGAVTEFSTGLTAGSGPDGITAGPEGNMWFTEAKGSRIGRITPTGVITEFSTGLTAESYPFGITKGSDGNLWFTEYKGNRIGRITPTGVITEFSTGLSAGSYPLGITAGPDGNIWFTEASGSRIGKITTAGVITEYSTGITAGSEPFGITAGPDGSLWFAEYNGNRIGKITTAGVITEYSTGITAGSDPYGITAGADGNLWFAEYNGNRIGRITPAGLITQYSAGITAGAGPEAVSAGADGNLWFTEGNGNRIGRVAIGGPVNTATRPAVSGTPQQGQTLVVTNGTWSGTPTPTYTNQWQDCNSLGEECSSIPGATSSTYTLAESDVGHTIRGVVTGTNTQGVTPAPSAATTTVLYATPASTAVPVIGGTVQQGRTLSTTNGSWTGSGLSYTYQWQDCNSLGEACTPISGATTSGYALQASDVGQTIRVTVTATNNGGSAPATSEQTTTVLIEAPVDTLAPSITGTVQQGETLTAATGSWSNSPTAYTYQWQRCNSKGEACASIVGATASTYTPAAVDVGSTLRLQVTATNAAGAVVAESPTTGLVVGPITEFSSGLTEASLPAGIADGPEGNLWFTEESGRIGRVTPAGVLTQYSTGITAGSQPSGITAGPDGNLWFTEWKGNRIGRITPAGVITEFSTGITPESRPSQIAAGPDGNLWFTENKGNKIGRITTAGVVTEFSTGISAESGPSGITKGPDGNLWFTEGAGNRIGRITTAGVITQYSTGLTAGSDPYGITAGPDGNLWFTELEGGRIGRITTAGLITQYSTGITAGSYPAGITAGADGNLWFAELEGGRVGRITTAGLITEYSTGITAGAHPDAITGGPDGNLWFSDEAGRIGRVAIGGPVNTAAPALSGTAKQGQTLSMGNGSWTGTPTPSYTYAWQDCNTAGEACAAISGATSSTYTLAESDVGHTIRGVVTGTNTLGATPAPSAQTTTVLYATPVNMSAPIISGTIQQGHLLPTTNGTWTGGGLSYTYQWQDCNAAGAECTPIAGATTSGYTLQASDIGKTIRVSVTATNTGGALSATSEKTTVVLIQAPVNTLLPSISGTVQQGETLTAANGSWSNSPTAYAYQWQRCNSKGEACASIGGATTSAYTPVALDVANTLRVQVTASNAGGGVMAESTATALAVGGITEFSSGLNPGASPIGLALGSDGNLWFADGWSTTRAIGRITTAGAITEFSAGLNGGANPQTIAAGAAGTLWFADLSSAIGKVTTAGAITEYTVTGAPQGITLGPDGNMWFTTASPASIGKITPAGVVTEYSTGLNAGSVPARGIVAGTDGNLWFTDNGTTKAVGKVTTGGVITEYSTGLNTGSVPTGLAVGPGGNMWFTDDGSTPAIGKVTTAGAINEYSTGLQAGADPQGIALAPDGNLWFGDTNFSTVYAVGRITPTGAITEYKTGLNATAHPNLVAVGADGNVWVSDGTGAVIRVAIGGPVNTVPPAVSGAAGQGQTLTASAGTWTGTPAPALSYQWQDCNSTGTTCSNISGATSSTYVLAAGDVGYYVGVLVSATNSFGSARSPSALTAMVVAAPGPLAAPTVTGTLQQGQTLTTTNGTWTNSPTSYGYAWLDCNSAGSGCTAIPGATSSTYVLTSSDVTHTIRSVVDAYNAGGSWSEESEKTGPVLGLVSGTITLYTAGLPSLNSVGQLAAGPDGNMWFTTGGSVAGIAKITPAGVITVYSAGLNSGSDPAGITLGPDGNMWFTDEGTTKAIGRITPSGVITEWSAGLNAGANPLQIAAGPTGVLWFTDGFGTTGAIGKVTTAGVITEYSSGLNSGSKPYWGIAAGADGNMWFTDAFGPTRAIGRITPEGVITEFSTGLKTGADPNHLTKGPEGNLWFTDAPEGTTPAIGKITTAGVITEYSTGIQAKGHPNGIALGADGNLWFGEGYESATGALGRITPSGVITEWSTGLGVSPAVNSVAAGPDGNIWFAESGGESAIGKITPG